MPLRKYKWILFDADNTLFDFDQASFMALKALLSELGIEQSEHENIWAIYEKINHEVWRSFEKGQMDAVTLRSRRFDLFFERIEINHMSGVLANKKYLDNLVEYSFLLDGALELLNKLDAYNLVIITNGLKEVQRRRYDKLNMDRYFEHLVVSDEIGKSKPNIDFFDHTFELIGQPSKSEVLVVGDNLMSDIKGGNNYGLDTVWYNPKGVPNTSEAVPSYEIKKLSDLATGNFI